MNRWIFAVVAVVLAAAIGGYAVLGAAKPPGGTAETQSAPSGAGPNWTEAAWPFPVDQWGQGWAFQCKAADCGAEVTLYIRPKIGFCNCQTGVADDEELDRVSDLDLVGNARSALGAGRPIKVHWMKGRSRDYKAGNTSAKSMLSLAFNNSCDVIVATVVSSGVPAAYEQAVLEFLNGDLMRQWAVTVLGG
jgi:hypothetical protein